MAGRLITSAQDATASFLSALQSMQNVAVDNTITCAKVCLMLQSSEGKNW